MNFLFCFQVELISLPLMLCHVTFCALKTNFIFLVTIDMCKFGTILSLGIRQRMSFMTFSLYSLNGVLASLEILPDLANTINRVINETGFRNKLSFLPTRIPSITWTSGSASIYSYKFLISIPLKCPSPSKAMTAWGEFLEASSKPFKRDCT